MSLVWLDSFDSYGNTSATPGPDLARRYAVAETTYFSIVAGRLGGYAVKSVNADYYMETPALTTNSTLIAHFSYRQDYALNNYGIMAMYDAGTQGMTLNLTAAGEIQVCLGGTALATTFGLGITLGVWYFIEFKVVCGAAGSYTLRVNGVSVLTASGVNTQAGTDAYHDRVRILGGPYSNPCTDSLYICDGAGSQNNDLLGDLKVTAIFPSGAGDSAQWTSSGGSNYAMVNENPPDDDASYVEDTVTGHKDLYAYGGLSGLGTINGVQITTDARLTDVGSFSLKTAAKTGGTESDDAGQAVTLTTWDAFRRIMETDPSGAAWSQSSVNASQFGVVVG